MEETPITYKGKTQSISAWAKELGLKYTTLHRRLARGYSVERALTSDMYSSQRKHSSKEVAKFIESRPKYMSKNEMLRDMVYYMQVDPRTANRYYEEYINL